MAALGKFGKKVFFLYPHSVIHDEMVTELFKHEYEIYLLKDHQKCIQILENNPDSILFINIDEAMDEPAWEEYIRSIMRTPATKDVRIGILTYNESQDLAKKYLMDIGLPCGYIRLKLGLAESTKIILRTLAANEAKGSRKFVRTRCMNNATFNFKHSGTIREGDINDISVAGMACKLYKNTEIPVRSLIKGIQLNLKGALCLVDGFLAGIRREDDDWVYVIMFTPNMSTQNKEKIRYYIQKNLQQEIGA